MKRRNLVLAFVPASVALVLVILAGLFIASSHPAAAQGQPSLSGQSEPAGDVCGTWWAAEPAPDPGPAYDTQLYTMDAFSANDVWAVGVQRNPVDGTSTGYVLHWNGATWTSIPVPTIEQYPVDTLTSVVAIAPNNVWISGRTYRSGEQGSKTLILRWNGSALSIVSSPSVPSVENFLDDIDAVSGNDIWAVGHTSSPYPYTHTPLTLHWNGSQWSIVPTPSISPEHAMLRAVTAINHNDVWAVGSYVDASRRNLRAISMHWNGTAWTTVDMPIPPGGTATDIALNGAASIASNDVWAVGNYVDFSPLEIRRTLTYHWNGAAWSIVPSPSHDDEDLIFNYLNDISALSSNDIWAVGYWSQYGSENLLYLHWDGTQWTMPPVPFTPDDDGLGGVVMTSPTDAWAVGYESHYTGSEYYDRPIIQRLAPRCATFTPTVTPEPTNTATPVPPRCPGERFTDVCPGDYFYEPVLALNDRGIVSGYNTSPPCDNSLHIPCFKPYNGSTRGQISKIVSLAAGFTEPVSGQTFEDAVPGSTFYEFIERMASRGIINGYTCGGANEPCVPPLNRPYFRSGNPVTRGQLSKMAVGAFNFTEPVTGQVFEDVPVGSTFYEFIGRMAARSIISGYACGGPGMPCVPPGNRPYFQPNNPVTRGQSSKIIHLSMNQPSPTPTRTATRTATSTPTLTATSTPEPTSTTEPSATSTSESTATSGPTETATATETVQPR